MANPLMCDSVWRNKQRYEEAEAQYQQLLAGTATRGAAAAGPKVSSNNRYLVMVYMNKKICLFLWITNIIF
jgi:hypothetical protein